MRSGTRPGQTKGNRSTINATRRHNRTSSRVRALLDAISEVEGDETLDSAERETKKRRLSALILDLPEVAPIVSEAFRELERNTRLSWEVRDQIVNRLEDALFKLPEAATCPFRMRGLLRRVTQWVEIDENRKGRSKDGSILPWHTHWAISIDAPRRGHGDGDEGPSIHEVQEGPAGIDVAETILQQERLREILRLAEAEGEVIHDTVLLVMLGWSYREVAALHEVSENAIAKRLERFRKTLEALGV